MSATAVNLPDFEKLWNYSNPAETETKFRELLTTVGAEASQDYVLQVLTQIARTQGLQQRFIDAHLTLDQVQNQLSAETPIAQIRYNLERGRVFNSSRNKAEAAPFFAKALEISQQISNDNLAVDAAHMLAIVESNPEKQMEWNLKALAIAENSQDPSARDWLGSLYNNIGWTYHDMGQYENALKLFEKGVVFREQKGSIAPLRIAKWTVARVLRSLKQFEKSLQMQLALLRDFESTFEKDGYVFEELGELYLATSQKELAVKYFALAYEELSKDAWFKENEAPRLQRIKELGLVP